MTKSSVATHLNPKVAYRHSKARQKLKFGRVIDAIAIDPYVYGDIEKLAMISVIQRISEAKSESNRDPPFCESDDIISNFSRFNNNTKKGYNEKGSMTVRSEPPLVDHSRNIDFGKIWENKLNIDICEDKLLETLKNTIIKRFRNSSKAIENNSKGYQALKLQKSCIIEERIICNEESDLESSKCEPYYYFDKQLRDLILDIERLDNVSENSIENTETVEDSVVNDAIQTLAESSNVETLDTENWTISKIGNIDQRNSNVCELHEKVSGESNFSVEQLNCDSSNIGNQEKCEISETSKNSSYCTPDKNKSFCEQSLSKLDKYTPQETIGEHSRFLSEYIDTNIYEEPSGWRSPYLVKALRNDHTVHHLQDKISVDKLSEGYSFTVRGSIGNEICFSLGKQLGEGSFATVFEKSDKKVAIKIQSPPCPWEYYIMKEIQKRSNDAKEFFILPFSCYLSKNASLIEMEYHIESHSLLDVVNSYRSCQRKIPELVSLFYTFEMLKCLEVLHRSDIIHGDFKADNILFCFQDKHQITPNVKVIDFGRSIDLSVINDAPSSNKKLGSSFCSHLLDDLPWTHSLDYLYLVESLHLLLFQEYPQKPYPSKDQFLEKISSKIPRYFHKTQWLELFNFLVNYVNKENSTSSTFQKSYNENSSLSYYRLAFENLLFPKNQLKLRSLLREEKEILKLSSLKHK